MISRSVTRSDLSRVKRERGLGLAPIVGASLITAAAQLTTQVISYWRQQSLNNANKVKATGEAEGFVGIFYGAQSASCGIKNSDGSAIWQYHQPQNYLSSLTALPVASPKFCESSIGGLIERCRLAEAYALLQSATSDAKSLAANFSYFANWYYAYGMQDIAFLNTSINSFWNAGYCAAVNPPSDGSGGDGTVNPPPVSSGQIIPGIPNSLLILGGIGIAGLLVLKS